MYPASIKRNNIMLISKFLTVIDAGSAMKNTATPMSPHFSWTVKAEESIPTAKRIPKAMHSRTVVIISKLAISHETNVFIVFSNQAKILNHNNLPTIRFIISSVTNAVQFMAQKSAVLPFSVLRQAPPSAA